MYNLALKETTKLGAPTQQKCSFQTSVVVHRYGRQNRSRPRKNFFRPNWRYLLNLTNLLHHGLDGGNQFNKVLPFFSLSNYPIGDANIKRRKELVSPFNEVKERYFDLFPDDRTTYLYDHNSGGEDWYKAPVDRFIDHMCRHLANAETELSIPEAFELALIDKKHEEDARRIEIQVQKEQAEVLFGYEERDWLKEQRRGNQFEEKFEEDPREEEKFVSQREAKLFLLVKQRMIDPRRVKIKIQDTEMEFYDVVKWITKNPQYKQYFHESIYWGDVPYHELYMQDINSVEHLEPSAPGDYGKYYDVTEEEANDIDGENDPTQKKGEDKDKKRIKMARQSLENDTMLEDLNVSMSGWARDLMEYFSDKSKVMVDDEHVKNANAAMNARNSMKKELGYFVEHALDRAFVSDPELFPVPGRTYIDGADEAMDDQRNVKGYVSSSLEDELASLFRNVPK